jgi:hypothetical protein
MYAFLNHSSRCLYKNYIQIGRLLRNRRGFRDRVASLSILPKKKLGQLVLKLFSNAERKTD